MAPELIPPTGPELTPADVGLPDQPVPDTGPDVIVPVAPTNPYLANPVSSAPLTPVAPSVQPVQTVQPTSVTTQTRSLTDDGMKKSRGYFGRAEANADAFSRADAARTDQDIAQTEASYDELDRGLEAQAEATRIFEAGMADLDRRQAEFHKENAELEKRLTDESIAERERYLADYEAKLAGVAQLSAQSGNPFATMGASQAYGLAGAAFIQGFLAVKSGAQLNVTGQIDKFIDRSIEDHQRQIAGAKADAQSSLHLYETAKSLAADKAEARAVYRGFVLQGLKTQIDATARRFNSNLALAQAQQTKAKLDLELNATRRALGDRHFERTHAFLQSERQAAVQEANLAFENRRLQLEGFRTSLAAQAAQAERAAKPEKLAPVVVDPSQVKYDKNGKPISGGKVVGVYNLDSPGVAQAQQKIAEAQTLHEMVSSGVSRLMELKPKGITWSKFVANKTSPEYQQWDTARNLLIVDIMKAKSGAAFSQAEWDRQATALKDNGIWTGDTSNLADELTAQSRNLLRSTIKSQIGSNIRAYRPDEAVDPRYGADETGYLPAFRELDTKGAQEYSANRSTEKPVPTAVSRSAAPVGARGDDADAGVASNSFAKFAASYGKPVGIVKHSKGGSLLDGTKTSVLHQPDWVRRMDTMALGIINPEAIKSAHEAGFFTLGQKPEGESESPEKIRADALAAIRAIRQGEGGASDAQRAYARHLESLLENPGEAQRLLLTDVGDR